jgi:hypothetical protein
LPFRSTNEHPTEVKERKYHNVSGAEFFGIPPKMKWNQKQNLFLSRIFEACFNFSLGKNKNLSIINFTIEIWLILPVVICLFQGLSHACLRITALSGICAWLITSDAICRKNCAVYRIIGYLGETPS